MKFFKWLFPWAFPVELSELERFAIYTSVEINYLKGKLTDEELVEFVLKKLKTAIH